jgi:hypothetical protein
MVLMMPIDFISGRYPARTARRITPGGWRYQALPVALPATTGSSFRCLVEGR